MSKLLVCLSLLSLSSLACMTQKDKEIYEEVFGPTPSDSKGDAQEMSMTEEEKEPMENDEQDQDMKQSQEPKKDSSNSLKEN